jgi:hypothetical protein
VVEWLTDPAARAHAAARIEAVAARVATGGSAARAADAVLAIASGGPATVGMPLPAARAA